MVFGREGSLVPSAVARWDGVEPAATMSVIGRGSSGGGGGAIELGSSGDPWAPELCPPTIICTGSGLSGILELTELR